MPRPARTPLTPAAQIRQAGLDGQRIVRHGLADVLAWLGQHPGPAPGDHRPVRWHAGAPWLATTLNHVLLAQGGNAATAIAQHALAYRRTANALPTHVQPDGRLLLTRDGTDIILDPEAGLILHVTVRAPTVRKVSRRTRPAKVAGPRVKGGKGQGRGPKDWRELHGWLTSAGYTTSKRPSGHVAIYSPHGARIFTVAATPSDYRALTQAASDLRRITGLRLRAPN